MSRITEMVISTWQTVQAEFLSARGLLYNVSLSILVGILSWFTEDSLYIPRIPYYLLGLVTMHSIAIISCKYKAQKKKARPVTPIEIERKEEEYPYLLALICFVTYVGVALVIYGTWYKGGDLIFAGNEGIRSKLTAIFASYTHWVSRSGELAAYAFGSPQNRWQMTCFIPAAVVCAPFVIIRLVTRSGISMSTTRGICFFVFCSCLLLISTSMTKEWYIFYAYSVSMNYLFPCILGILFLSYYNYNRWKTRGVQNRTISSSYSVICFFLGLYVCWGGEALSLIIHTALIVWVFQRMRKSLEIPSFCWHGVQGAVLGSTMLFAAPALSSRTKIVNQTKSLDVSQFSPEEMLNFVTNLTWEKVELLKGTSEIITLNDIPFWQHLFFLPYLLERYVQCSIYVITVLGILLIFLLTDSAKNKRKHLLILSGAISLSLIGACAYLYSCIPNQTSYFPATMVLLCGVAYLYWNCKMTFFKSFILVMAVATVSLSYLVPAGVEAWQYKKYERMRNEEIARQKAKGLRHIVLPPPYEKEPDDPLGLITKWDLNEDATQWPNPCAAKAYQVESISQIPIHKE